MKKIIIIAIMAMLSMPAMAQSNRIYCEIVGTLKFMSSKIVVDVDFGQQRAMASNNKLVGEDGKPIQFESMVDAMNHMGEMGWRFEQAYVVTMGQVNVYHWLLSKDVLEGEDGTEGLQTKTQFRQEQKQADTELVE
jgi:hypothetical protein